MRTNNTSIYFNGKTATVSTFGAADTFRVASCAARSAASKTHGVSFFVMVDGKVKFTAVTL